ncbi:MAG: phosphatidate cytidylyltransferase, partial [Candidatus Eremiobacteraeota bacterium]|nr:phosphatidate cytidylyltransferase [Candidatus Eremiobacteraeota bacterium]
MRAAAPAGARRSGSLGIRRIGIGLALAVVGIACVFWSPAFTLLIVLIAMGSLWE